MSGIAMHEDVLLGLLRVEVEGRLASKIDMASEVQEAEAGCSAAARTDC